MQIGAKQGAIWFSSIVSNMMRLSNKGFIDLNTCSRSLWIALTDQICQADGNRLISSGLKGKHAFKPCRWIKSSTFILLNLCWIGIILSMTLGDPVLNVWHGNWEECQVWTRFGSCSVWVFCLCPQMCGWRSAVDLKRNRLSLTLLNNSYKTKKCMWGRCKSMQKLLQV